MNELVDCMLAQFLHRGFLHGVHPADFDVVLSLLLTLDLTRWFLRFGGLLYEIRGTSGNAFCRRGLVSMICQCFLTIPAR